jgi:TetR/AcrR family transcriptional regulator, cholesterol catabolism regulator
MTKRPRRTPEAKARIVIDTVIELLESGGYESVQVREVARRAQISLVTLYSLYPSRDELIVSAVESWLNDNVLNDAPNLPADATLSEGLLEIIRTAMKPWEEHPRILEALFLAREAPGSERLLTRGYAFAETALASAIKDADPDFVSDLYMILWYVHSAVMARCAKGEIPISDALPIMERTVYRLTADEDARGSVPRSWRWRQRRRSSIA